MRGAVAFAVVSCCVVAPAGVARAGESKGRTSCGAYRLTETGGTLCDGSVQVVASSGTITSITLDAGGARRTIRARIPLGDAEPLATALSRLQDAADLLTATGDDALLDRLFADTVTVELGTRHTRGGADVGCAAPGGPPGAGGPAAGARGALVAIDLEPALTGRTLIVPPGCAVIAGNVDVADLRVDGVLVAPGGTITGKTLRAGDASVTAAPSITLDGATLRAATLTAAVITAKTIAADRLSLVRASDLVAVDRLTATGDSRISAGRISATSATLTGSSMRATEIEVADLRGTDATVEATRRITARTAPGRITLRRGSLTVSPLVRDPDGPSAAAAGSRTSGTAPAGSRTSGTAAGSRTSGAAGTAAGYRTSGSGAADADSIDACLRRAPELDAGVLEVDGTVVTVRHPTLTTLRARGGRIVPAAGRGRASEVPDATLCLVVDGDATLDGTVVAAARLHAGLGRGRILDGRCSPPTVAAARRVSGACRSMARSCRWPPGRASAGSAAPPGISRRRTSSWRRRRPADRGGSARVAAAAWAATPTRSRTATPRASPAAA